MLYLMSTTIIPGGANGLWRMEAQSLQEALNLVHDEVHVSAVGHTATAAVMAELLDYPVEANRITVVPREGDRFLCFRLLSRPPEGAVLNRTQLEAIGFEWALMTFIEAG